MFEGLEESQLKGALEALLFVTDEPVTVITLSDMVQADPSQVEEALLELKADLEQRQGGICLAQVAGGWRLFTKACYHRLLEQYVLSWDTRKLSRAALETLAIVAYGQPITRSGISTVRGVNSDSSLNSLIDKGLVREAGVSDAPGNPVLYATTRTFLEKFGLASTNELPPLEDYAPDEETVSFLRQSLKGNRFSVDDSAVELAGEDADGPLFVHGGPGLASEDGGDAHTAGNQGGFELEGEPGDLFTEGAAAEGHSVDDLMRSMMADALAQSAGLVEKINFDELEFEE